MSHSLKEQIITINDILMEHAIFSRVVKQFFPQVHYKFKDYSDLNRYRNVVNKSINFQCIFPLLYFYSCLNDENIFSSKEYIFRSNGRSGYQLYWKYDIQPIYIKDTSGYLCLC